MEYFQISAPPEPDRREILRYARAKGDGSLDNAIDSVISEAEGTLSYRLCYIRVGVTVSDGRVTLGKLTLTSRDLCKNLEGCTEAVIFAATVGAGIDRLIMKYGSISPSRALLFQAYGSERIESLCDCFCAFLTEKTGKTLRPRFSCGYGDLPLTVQKDIFALLDCTKIGLTLNDSLSMSPTKSVTAIVGVK